MASHRGLTVGGDLSARPPLLLSSLDSPAEQGRGDQPGPSREQAQRLLLLCPCQRTVRGVALGAPSVSPQELLAPYTLEHPATVTALCPAPGGPRGAPGEDRGQGGAHPGPRERGATSVAGAGSEGREGDAEGSSEVRLWAACADGHLRLWGLRPGRGRTGGCAEGREGASSEAMLLEGGERGGEGPGGADRGVGALVRGAALRQLWDVGAPIESMVVLRVEREASGATQKQGKPKGSNKQTKEVEHIAYLSTWRAARGAAQKGGPYLEGSPGAGPEKGVQKEGRLLCFSLTRGVPLRFPAALSRVLCRPTPPRLVLSPSGALVACCSGPSVFLWRAHDPFRWAKLRHTRQLTCVAVSPCSRHVAAADVSGRVMVWHDVGRERLWGEASTTPPQHQIDNLDNPNPSTQETTGPGGVSSWKAPGAPGKRAGPVAPQQRRAGDFRALVPLQHWHASAVAALCFSADGAYLLSGGAEAVLVLCQLRTGALRFLPRLGGPITGITPLTPLTPSSPPAPTGASATPTGAHPGGVQGGGGGVRAADQGDGALRFAVQCSGVNAVMLVDMAPMSASLLLQGVLMPPVYPAQLPWPPPLPPVRALLPPQLLPPPWVALGAPAVDPLTGLLILPARGARLQFVDISEGGFSAPLAVLQVAPRNAVQQVAPSHQRHSPVPTRNAASPAHRGGQPPPEPVCVTHIGISPDGLSLVTAEVRMAEGDSPLSAPTARHHSRGTPYGPSARARVDSANVGYNVGLNTPTLGQGSCLRFWARTVLPAAGASRGGAATASSSSSKGGVAGGSAFLLNSRVDNPHGALGAAVAALVVHPGGALAVTCSSAAPEFKLWCKLQRRNRPAGGTGASRGLLKVGSKGGAKEGRRGKQGGQGEREGEVEVFCWRCKSVGSFQGPAAGAPEASVMSSADFSPDGNLLAVASGACVTLWDPHSCSLLSVLPDPLPPLLPPLSAEDSMPLVHPRLHAVTHVKLVGAGPEALVVTASLCARGEAGRRGKQGGWGKGGLLGGRDAEQWLCVRSVASLEVLWSVRARVLGLLGGGEVGEMAGGVPLDAGVLRPEIPPGFWAALLLLEGGEEGGEQGREGKGVRKGVPGSGAGKEGEGEGEGMEVEEEEEEDEGEDEEEDAEGDDGEKEELGSEEEEEKEEEEEGNEGEEEDEATDEHANGNDRAPASHRLKDNSPGSRQRSSSRQQPSSKQHPYPRLLPVVAVFEGANSEPVAAWAVPEEAGARGGPQGRTQAKQQGRGGAGGYPPFPLSLGATQFLLPSMSFPGPLNSEPLEGHSEAGVGLEAVPAAGAGQKALAEAGAGPDAVAVAGAGVGVRAVELMVVRQGGEVLRLCPPRSHSLAARGKAAVYPGSARNAQSLQQPQQPENLLEAMFGKQIQESPARGGKEEESVSTELAGGMGAVQLGLSLQSTPSHILPSLDKLLPQFMNQLVAGPPTDGS